MWAHAHAQECCRPYLRGNEAAPTPEAVMRARFTAYVKNAPQYIVRPRPPAPTAAPASPPATRLV